MTSRVARRCVDVAVVGAGTAGCLLANRLSRDPGKRVLLLEAGRRDIYPWIHIPVGYLYCIGNPRTDWLYSTEAEAGLGGRSGTARPRCWAVRSRSAQHRLLAGGRPRSGAVRLMAGGRARVRARLGTRAPTVRSGPA